MFGLQRDVPRPLDVLSRTAEEAKLDTRYFCLSPDVGSLLALTERAPWRGEDAGGLQGLDGLHGAAHRLRGAALALRAAAEALRAPLPGLSAAAAVPPAGPPQHAGGAGDAAEAACGGHATAEPQGSKAELAQALEAQAALAGRRMSLKRRAFKAFKARRQPGAVLFRR